MLSTIFLGEYIEPIKYVKTALGIAHWIKNTPAAKPDKLKIFIMPSPINGPIKTLHIEEIKADLKEKTFNLVRAIPKDINIKNIAVYAVIIVVFTKKIGVSIS